MADERPYGDYTEEIRTLAKQVQHKAYGNLERTRKGRAFLSKRAASQRSQPGSSRPAVRT